MPIRVREVGPTKPPTALLTMPRRRNHARLIPRGNTLAWCRSFFTLPFAHREAFLPTASTFAERYSRRLLAVKVATHHIAKKRSFAAKIGPPPLSKTHLPSKIRDLTR